MGLSEGWVQHSIFCEHTRAPQLCLSVELSLVFFCFCTWSHGQLWITPQALTCMCIPVHAHSLPDHSYFYIWTVTCELLHVCSYMGAYQSPVCLSYFPDCPVPFWTGLPVSCHFQSQLQPKGRCSLGLLHSFSMVSPMASDTQGCVVLLLSPSFNSPFLHKCVSFHSTPVPRRGLVGSV